VVADPHAVATSWSEPRMRAIAELAETVTRTPWALTRAHHHRFHSAGLSDEDILHVVALSSYFGHLNRIADATGVPLDYAVKEPPPATDPGVPPLPVAPARISGRPAIELSRRPATDAALKAWRTYLYDRDEPISRRQRTLIVRCVASWLGDAGISPPTDLTANPLDDALRAVVEQISLAPWQLSDRSFDALRAEGFDDAMIFDVCATASSAGVWIRLEVALAALGTR
jgi:alkylhydroperoxidase family enzyme